MEIAVYFAVRHCIEPSWLNDRDQFLYPQDTWESDTEFQSNCLTFTLFHGQNRISAEHGVNHFIPFTEQEVDAKEKFASHFMTDFMAGKLKPEADDTLFTAQTLAKSRVPTAPLAFSEPAQAVFAAGRELWCYYHAQPGANPDASFYDIRAHFQGRDAKGKMKKESPDTRYMELVAALRAAIKKLAQAIAPKVYEHGFLRE